MAKLIKNAAFGLTIFFISTALFLVIYSNYDAHWSPKARQGYINQQNIKSIKIGMSVAEVAAIMGKPIYINRIESVPQSTSYSYQMPPGSSKYCNVNFDASGRVIRTYYLAK